MTITELLKRIWKWKNKMEQWLPITKKQKKEILFSLGGVGYHTFRIQSFMIGIVVMLFWGCALVWSILAKMNPSKYASLDKGDMLGIILLVPAMFIMWIFVSVMTYWYAVLIRLWRIRKGNITYLYCKKGKIKATIWGANYYSGILKDGTEIDGKMEFSDYYDISYANNQSDRLIAYKIDGKEKIYLSYVKK